MQRRQYGQAPLPAAGALGLAGRIERVPQTDGWRLEWDYPVQIGSFLSWTLYDFRRGCRRGAVVLCRCSSGTLRTGSGPGTGVLPVGGTAGICKRELFGPEDEAHEGHQGVGESGQGLGIPDGLAPQQPVGDYGDPVEEVQQDGCGAGDGRLRPLALGFHAQVSVDLLAGDLHLPALQARGEDGGRAPVGVGAEPGLRFPASVQVAQEQLVQGDRGLARHAGRGGAGRTTSRRNRVRKIMGGVMPWQAASSRRVA